MEWLAHLPIVGGRGVTIMVCANDIVYRFC